MQEFEYRRISLRRPNLAHETAHSPAWPTSALREMESCVSPKISHDVTILDHAGLRIIGVIAEQRMQNEDNRYSGRATKAATDMQAFAAGNDDLNLPDQVVLPFIMNFLTDQRLRKLSADGPTSGGFEK